MHRYRLKFPFRKPNSGQSLVEYSLIVALVVIAFSVALAATGPAIGNVFSNTICNLLDQPDCGISVASLPDSEAFWQTVTWAAQQTPGETPFPTNVPAPPPATATAGPSPTNTPVTPTATPAPSSTPPPSPTPTDFSFTAPDWIDRVDPDTTAHWRIDNSVYLGGEEWVGRYYANKTLTGTPDYTRANSEISGASPWSINFVWGSSESPIAGWPSATPGDNFSISWTRRIYLTAPLTLSFTTSADDGVRLWLLGADTGTNVPSCSSGVPYGGNATGSNGSPGSGCLLIDNWANQGVNTRTSRPVTLNPGTHTLRLDYFENTGGGSVGLQINYPNRSVNTNDSALPTGTPNCDWNRRNSTIASSRQFMWDEFGTGDFPQNMRCTLEFRGSITVPTTLANPRFQFWSMWDFRGGGTLAAIEFADWTTRNPATGVYPAGAWTRVNLHQNNSANYNWTRYNIAIPAAALANSRVAFRFVLESGTGNTTPRRWYLDDITIQSFNPDATNFTIGRLWDLNSETQRTDFITSARWGLSVQVNHGGMAWNDSPGGPEPYVPGSSNNTNYNRNDESPGSAANEVRVHYVEFNGWIDVSGTAPDAEGHTGDPILSFWHAYEIGANGSLEIQYTRDPFISAAAPTSNTPTNWTTVPAASPREGLILPSAGSTRTQTSMTFREVDLRAIPNFNTQRFRLRFAMILPNTASEEDGWWIDDIQIERLSAPRFTNYPFIDDAEISDDAWLMGGNWARLNTTGVFNSAWVYTDSPVGNYTHNTDASMQLRYPIDFNNDTPEHAIAPNTLNPGGVANRPVLSFWHWRRLNQDDHFIVEWRRSRDNTWNTAWSYTYSSTTDNGIPTGSQVFNSRTGIQIGWEHVVIDLTPILTTATTGMPPADLTDDDIMIRFRLDARNNTNVEDGVYVDNIRIENYTETSWQLWTTDPDGGGPLTAGNGDSYTDGIDAPSDWWNRWQTGGSWSAVDWSTPNGGGLRSFHDSPTGQTQAPFYQTGSNLYDGVNYVHDTFSVLEMNRIIDLRGVPANRRPTLEFWHRYYVGDGDVLRVQVSVEDTTLTGPCGGTQGNMTDPPRQCYERTANWGRWTTIYSLNGNTRNYSWTRQLEDLSTFVGRRIRIRFVLDALDSATNLRDGWYIDNIRLFYNNYTSPAPFQLTFFDAARNLDRWITEGIWGLDPEVFRGSGGGAANLGSNPWNGYWFRCASCGSSAANTQLNGIPDTPAGYAAARTAAGAGNFYPNPQPQFLLDINFDFGGNGPRNPDGSIWRSSDMVARFTRDISVVAGEYTFITVSDDGVRMRYTPGPATSTPIGNTNPSHCTGWNMICNWAGHSRTVDMRTVTFPAAGNYRLILEWYEGSGDAAIVLSAGANNFSFSDSPKLGVGPSFPVINSTTYSSSSLILNGVIDMCGANSGTIEYYTLYDTAGVMYFEVTTNGGLDWDFTPHDGGSGFSSSDWTGTNIPPNPWQLRRHNLDAYRNRFMGMRFRLFNDTSSLRNGWWVTDITVGAASVTPRASLPVGTCP